MSRRPIYRHEFDSAERARADMVRGHAQAGTKPLRADEHDGNAHHAALVESERVEDARRGAIARLGRTVRDSTRYRLAVQAVTQAMTVDEVEHAAASAETEQHSTTRTDAARTVTRFDEKPGAAELARAEMVARNRALSEQGR